MEKKQYIQPRVNLEIVEIEYSIAAGSAATSPENESGSVGEQWDTQNESKGFDW